MKMNRIRDSVHGFIYFSDAEKKVIDMPEFQRLRYIKQLALTSYIYPGAVHTRFEHSLGVMEIASRMFDTLCSKSEIKDKIIRNLSKVELDLPRAMQVLRLASLLHDIGHLPFSHGGENALPGGAKHEDVSISIIEELSTKIESLYFQDVTKYVIQLLQKEVTLPELKLLKDIISGSIDADRMDYLLRDSHHCGVDYGYFDYKRLIQSLCVVDGINGGLDLAVEHGGIHAVEALILARYYMFTQVYFHKTRKIYDYYLTNYMTAWMNNIKNLTDVTKYDDITLTNELRAAADKGSDEFNIDAYRICYRKHHSMIYETSEFTDAIDRRKAEGIYKRMSNIYSDDYDLVIDHGKGNIHKFFVEGKDEVVGDEFRVIRNNREYLITKESHIIKEMPKQFYVIRIYISPKDIQKSIDKEFVFKLREEALKIEREVR